MSRMGSLIHIVHRTSRFGAVACSGGLSWQIWPLLMTRFLLRLIAPPTSTRSSGNMLIVKNNCDISPGWLERYTGCACILQHLTKGMEQYVMTISLLQYFEVSCLMRCCKGLVMWHPLNFSSIEACFCFPVS